MIERTKRGPRWRDGLGNSVGIGCFPDMPVGAGSVTIMTARKDAGAHDVQLTASQALELAAELQRAAALCTGTRSWRPSETPGAPPIVDKKAIRSSMMEHAAYCDSMVKPPPLPSVGSKHETPEDLAQLVAYLRGLGLHTFHADIHHGMHRVLARLLPGQDPVRVAHAVLDVLSGKRLDWEDVPPYAAVFTEYRPSTYPGRVHVLHIHGITDSDMWWKRDATDSETALREALGLAGDNTEATEGAQNEQQHA